MYILYIYIFSMGAAGRLGVLVFCIIIIYYYYSGCLFLLFFGDGMGWGGMLTFMFMLR